MTVSTMLTKVTANVIESLVSALPNLVERIIMYGSYAREDYTDESDIDILVLLNCNKEDVKKYRSQVSRIASRIGLENDVEVSLLLRDSKTFEQGASYMPFYQNILTEGVSLYEQECNAAFEI